jgi:hypothetical protein
LLENKDHKVKDIKEVDSKEVVEEVDLEVDLEEDLEVIVVIKEDNDHKDNKEDKEDSKDKDIIIVIVHQDHIKVIEIEDKTIEITNKVKDKDSQLIIVNLEHIKTNKLNKITTEEDKPKQEEIQIIIIDLMIDKNKEEILKKEDIKTDKEEDKENLEEEDTIEIKVIDYYLIK